MNKYTQHYFKKLAETNYQEKRRAKDILPMEGFIPAAQDYVLPFMGANRAGRAKAMALASGTKEKDIPLSVKHPLTYGVLSGFGAGAVGGLTSAAALGGLVAANNNGLIDVNNNMGGYIAATTGAGILAALGIGVAALVKHRKNMRQISEKYENTDSINPEMPNIGTRFLPMSGFADKGEMDAYRYMKGKTNLKPRIGIATSLASIPYTPGLAAPLFGLYNKQQAINQQEEDMQPPPVRVRLGIG